MIEVFISKPLYNNFAYINESYIKKAEKLNQKLHIKTPKGEITCTPQEWLKGAKRMEKVFLRPNEPMVLFGNNIPLFKTEENNLFNFKG